MPADIFGATDRAFALVPTSVQTGAYSAAANDLALMDTTAGALTATLPAAPPDGTVAGVKLVAGTHPVTVAAGGTDVLDAAGGATSMNWSTLYQSVTLQYVAATGVWVRVSSYGASGGSSGVATFNGRSGAVVPATNDYSFSQLSGSATAAQLPSASTSAKGIIQLDGTAGDIAALGTQAAGSTGKAADAGHVHPTTGLVDTTSAQTIAGVKTFSSRPVLPGPPSYSAFAPVAGGGTTVTNATATTLLAAGLTVPAGGLAAGQVYRIKAWGGITTTSTSQTINIGLYWGGVSGTNLLNWGAQQINGSSLDSGAAWMAEYEVVAVSSTSLSVGGWDGISYYFSSLTEGNNTVSNTAAEQFVIGVTAGGATNPQQVSITVAGFYFIRLI